MSKELVGAVSCEQGHQCCPCCPSAVRCSTDLGEILEFLRNQIEAGVQKRTGKVGCMTTDRLLIEFRLMRKKVLRQVLEAVCQLECTSNCLCTIKLTKAFIEDALVRNINAKNLGLPSLFRPLGGELLRRISNDEVRQNGLRVIETN